MWSPGSLAEFQDFHRFLKSGLTCAPCCCCLLKQLGIVFTCLKQKSTTSCSSIPKHLKSMITLGTKFVLQLLFTEAARHSLYLPVAIK